MRARRPHFVLLPLLLAMLGADYRTRNFFVTAPTAELAEELAVAAERYRRTLAVEWLGEELPDWKTPCPVVARVADHLRPNGLTSYGFRRGRAFGWRINVQGDRERVLDSVLPHEITHAIFATHFGRPLPRWADEGVSIVVEDSDARDEQQQKLIEYLNAGRVMSLHQLFATHEYPPDILPLYSQGYSVVCFLVEQGGRQKFIEFIGDGIESNDWAATTQRHYDYDNLGQMQHSWLKWVAASQWPGATLASNEGGAETSLASTTSLLP